MEKSNNAAPPASSKKAVAVYSAALFVMVVVFIVISYFINERGESKVEELNAQQTTALQKIDALRSENERLQSELEESEAYITRLEEELKQAHLDWAEDTKRIENRYKSDYNDLLQEYNRLLAQIEAEGETE